MKIELNIVKYVYKKYLKVSIAYRYAHSLSIRICAQIFFYEH